MANPSVNWRETVAPDETTRHQAAAESIRRLQKVRSERFGTGRALHRKGLLALPAEVEILPDLPDFARHGLFEAPARFPAFVRLSNGGMDVKSNASPDIRGFAISVRGLDGVGALGGQTHRQDFLLINQDSFSSPTSVEFMGVVEAASRGQGALLAYMIRTHGLFGGLGRLKRLAGALGKPFAGFAGEGFNSAVPIACGPYAARVLLAPRSRVSRGSADPVEHMRALLAKGALEYDLKLQFFVDEKTTPIEDASVVWPVDVAPLVTVARLTVQAEPAEGSARATLTNEIEKSAFDPWAGLEAHRPLGEIMRARKVAYFASEQARGAV